MKLNNKGFAISVVLYSMVILIIGIMYLLLDVVNSRYRMSREVKDDVVEYINSQGINTISQELLNRIATTKIINTGALSLHSGNYYYTGNDPDNYVYFNSELWRIIGVIVVDDVRYLKIVRNNYISENTSDNHRIINSNIFNYLNNTYYNSMNSSKTMIKKINWYNSEYSTNLTALNAYQEEKKATSFSENYVGLINGSDFGYTADNVYLTNYLSNYASSINDNWLALTNDYFTMSFSGTKINVVSNGNLSSTDNMTAYIYPCVYLKKDVLIIDGAGERTNPYILSQ